jgi:hypothetical protein
LHCSCLGIARWFMSPSTITYRKSLRELICDNKSNRPHSPNLTKATGIACREILKEMEERGCGFKEIKIETGWHDTIAMTIIIWLII